MQLATCPPSMRFMVCAHCCRRSAPMAPDRAIPFALHRHLPSLHPLLARGKLRPSLPANFADASDFTRRLTIACPCFNFSPAIHSPCQCPRHAAPVVSPLLSKVKVKVKVIRPEAWIKETLPVGLALTCAPVTPAPCPHPTLQACCARRCWRSSPAPLTSCFA